MFFLGKADLSEARLDDLSGSVDLTGDAGRLAKVLPSGANGVLDGRSIGGNANPRSELSPDLFEVLLYPVGARVIDENSSSSSSIEGKLCENSERLRLLACGDVDGEEVGDGARVDGDTKLWGDG